MEDLNFSTETSNEKGKTFTQATPLNEGSNFSKSSLLSLNFYRQFFDITTEDIVSRIKKEGTLLTLVECHIKPK